MEKLLVRGKKFLIGLSLLLLVVSLSSQDNDSLRDLNGEWWTGANQQERFAYVRGYVLGEVFLGEVLGKVLEDSEVNQLAIEATLYYYSIEEITNGITEFYQQNTLQYPLIYVTFIACGDNLNKLKSFGGY